MRILFLVSFFALFGHLICSKESESDIGEIPTVIYQVEKLSKQPIIKKFSATIWDGEVEGKVVVVFVILKDGSVGEVKIISSKHKILSKIAINDVRQFIFSPGEIDGSPVNTIATMEIPYILRSK